jgi:carboxypeptidase D
MFDKDIATGTTTTANPAGSEYSTSGPDNVFNVTNVVPSHPVSECYLWATFLTCTQVQTEMLRNGTAILQDYIMIGYEVENGTIHYY